MAKRFEFRLQTLLDVRALREREAKRAFAAQQAEIARLDQLNRDTAAEIERQQAALLDAQQAGAIDLITLQRGRAWIAHLRKTIAQRLDQRVGMTRVLDELRGKWTAARRELRIVDKLRERRWNRYRKDRQRREQAESDELARQLPMFGLGIEGMDAAIAG